MHTVNNTVAHHPPFTACCSSSLCRYQPNTVLVTCMVDHRLLWAHLNDLLDKQDYMLEVKTITNYYTSLAGTACKFVVLQLILLVPLICNFQHLVIDQLMSTSPVRIDKTILYLLHERYDCVSVQGVILSTE